MEGSGEPRASTGVVIRAGEARERPMSRPGARSTRLVDDAVGARALDMHMNLLEPGGGSGPYHFHTDSENVYYVVEGSLEVRIGDETSVLGAGDVVFLPPGVPHAVSNTGDRVARLLEIYAPPKPDFVEVGRGS